MPEETQAQRIARVEDENARLREDLDAARGTSQEPASEEHPSREAAPLRSRRGAGIARSVVSVVLIVLGALLAPVALVANTANRLLTDTDFFVATLQPIADDEAVQEFLVEQVTATIRTQAELDRVVADLFDGFEGLNLPPRSIAALRLLERPAAAGLDALVEGVVTRVVTSDQFHSVMAESLRISHSQLVAALSGRSDLLVINSQGQVGIAMGPILDRVRSALSDEGFPFASLIPKSDRVIVIAQSAQIAQYVWFYQFAVAVGPWLQWVVVALFAAGVIVARRRATAIMGVGIGLAVAAGVLWAAVRAGRVFAVSATSATVPTAAVGVIYDTMVASILASVTAAVVVGLAVALVAYLAGSYRSSRALRGLAESGAVALREAGDRHGLSTGRFGEFVFRARLAIRVVVGLSAAAIILFVRPLTPTIVIWTLVLALLTVAIARILERPVSSVPADTVELPVG